MGRSASGAGGSGVRGIDPKGGREVAECQQTYPFARVVEKLSTRAGTKLRLAERVVGGLQEGGQGVGRIFGQEFGQFRNGVRRRR